MVLLPVTCMTAKGEMAVKKWIALLLSVMMLMSCAALAEIEVKDFPEVPADYSKVVDPANPLKTVFSGAYRVAVTVGEAERRAVVYLAEDFAQTQGFVMIVPATGVTPEQALEEGGWKAVADANGLYLMVLDTTEAAADAAFLDAATSLADTRNYWRQPEGRNYLAAYGDNADAALAFAEGYLPNVWAGIAVFGDLTVGTGDIKNEAGIELPVWLFAAEMNENEEALVELFKGYNGCTDEVFSNAYADRIYFPNQKVNGMLLNDQPVSQVRVTVKEDAAALNAERAAVVYDFFKLATREVGYGPKAIRTPHDLSDWGATVESVVVDGITRSWVQYVPAKIRETAEGKAPLLVAVHGNALTGDYFAERTGFIRLAEEFGFIVVFPNGSINTGIAPTWNNDRAEGQWDDVGFLTAMIEDVKAKQPVDASRVYYYGHSMGGMLMQKLVGYMDGTFAAVCATGCAFKSVQVEAFEKVTPVWVAMGENDFFGTKIESEDAQAFIAAFKGYNHAKDEGIAFRAGRFENYEWCDENGMPVVRYTIVDEMPHTGTLDLGYQFFCWLSRFSRNDDGTVAYGAGIYNAK